MKRYYLMEHFKKKSNLFIIFCFLYLLSNNLYASKLNAKYLLNSYYNPNRLVFRLSSSVFECPLLGVSVPYYITNNQCMSESFMLISNLAIGFFQNNLNLEQMYDVKIIDGYCLVSYGNTNFNEKIIIDGYGVVNASSISNPTLLNKLLYLENLAIENKLGLWNSFYKEMQCFKDIYK